jgi:hypothetical protein
MNGGIRSLRCTVRLFCISTIVAPALPSVVFYRASSSRPPSRFPFQTRIYFPENS